MERQGEFERRKRFGGGNVAILLKYFQKLGVQFMLGLEISKNAIGNCVEKWEIGRGIFQGRCFPTAMSE
jgi:hypothetical protein